MDCEQPEVGRRAPIVLGSHMTSTDYLNQGVGMADAVMSDGVLVVLSFESLD